MSVLKFIDYHYYVQWAVYLICLLGVVRGVSSWVGKKTFVALDNILWAVLVIVVIGQAILGFLTFFSKPSFSLKVLEHMFIGIIVTGLPLMFSIWRKADPSKRFRVLFITALVCFMLSVVSINVLANK
ncbi:MAG: hypothetical protein KIH69_005940 [Anaerolineae bacterium]|nr:hypothetical protein [Anaerolineae bacterium]